MLEKRLKENLAVRKHLEYSCEVHRGPFHLKPEDQLR